MRVDAFDFDLPEERIALHPADPRDSARLLQVGATGALSDHIVQELPDLLQPGDLLVLNQTRVIPAQLAGLRQRPGAAPLPVGVTLMEAQGGAQDNDQLRWKAMARPGKRIKVGDTLVFPADGPQQLVCHVAAKGDDGLLDLTFEGTAQSFANGLQAAGMPPLPPYIAAKRGYLEDDKQDYQTVYAQDEGSVAAPTAGLHFTDALFEALDARGVNKAFVTLHVGMGTFLPVKAEDTSDHKMHAEWGQITADVADQINATRAAGGRIVAVGTTSLRTLESAVQEDGTVMPFDRETDIFITPGYRFKAIDALMTNFHLPKSTLFMLVSALGGLERMQAAYAHAIESQYRFYSYGDGSLLWKANP
jgi:S-adenosylmethionine:tRNA ribosyltransferase-isomerase